MSGGTSRAGKRPSSAQKAHAQPARRSAQRTGNSASVHNTSPSSAPPVTKPGTAKPSTRAGGISSKSGGVPAHVREFLSHSSGAPLPVDVRASMEQQLGADFSGVRVHQGSRAAESAESVHARAYTVGSDVVFNRGELSPRSAQGRKLLAHELAHVVQQSRGGPKLDGGHRQAMEQSAQQAAARSGGARAGAAGQSGTGAVQGGSAVGLAREPKPDRIPPDPDELKFDFDGQEVHIEGVERSSWKKQWAKGKPATMSEPVGFDIDEPHAVGQKGVKQGRKFGRAIDSANRQLLDAPTNRVSKRTSRQVPIVERAPSAGPVSVADDPGALFSRDNLSEVKEFKDLFDRALRKYSGRRDLKPTKLKALINADIRRQIKTGKSPAAKAIREALRKMNWDPKTLRPKVAESMKLGKGTKAGGGKTAGSGRGGKKASPEAKAKAKAKAEATKAKEKAKAKEAKEKAKAKEKAQKAKEKERSKAKEAKEKAKAKEKAQKAKQRERAKAKEAREKAKAKEKAAKEKSKGAKEKGKGAKESAAKEKGGPKEKSAPQETAAPKENAAGAKDSAPREKSSAPVNEKGPGHADAKGSDPFHSAQSSAAPHPQGPHAPTGQPHVQPHTPTGEVKAAPHAPPGHAAPPAPAHAPAAPHAAPIPPGHTPATPHPAVAPATPKPVAPAPHAEAPRAADVPHSAATPHPDAPHVNAPHATAPHGSAPHVSTPHAPAAPHVSAPHAPTVPHGSAPHVGGFGKLGKFGKAMKVLDVAGKVVTVGMGVYNTYKEVKEGQSVEEATAGNAAQTAVNLTSIGGPADMAINMANTALQFSGASEETKEKGNLLADVTPSTFGGNAAKQFARGVVNIAKGDNKAIDKQVDDINHGAAGKPLQGYSLWFTKIIPELASGKDSYQTFDEASKMINNKTLEKAGNYLGDETYKFVNQDLPEAAEFAKKDIDRLKNSAKAEYDEAKGKAKEKLDEAKSAAKEAYHDPKGAAKKLWNSLSGD